MNNRQWMFLDSKTQLWLGVGRIGDGGPQWQTFTGEEAEVLDRMLSQTLRDAENNDTIVPTAIPTEERFDRTNENHQIWLYHQVKNRKLPNGGHVILKLQAQGESEQITDDTIAETVY